LLNISVSDNRGLICKVASHQARRVHDSEVASRVARSASSIKRGQYDLHALLEVWNLM